MINNMLRTQLMAIRPAVVNNNRVIAKPFQAVVAVDLRTGARLVRR